MAEDDHKFISERLLNLSLPAPENCDPNVPIPLEACLEGPTTFEITIKKMFHRLTNKQSTFTVELMSGVNWNVEEQSIQYTHPKKPLMTRKANASMSRRQI